MMSVAIDQIALLAIEASLVSGLLLALFHKRSAWGLSPLYIALGVFQHMQVVLAMGVYVDIGGLVVSPGSVVLFTASLFAVLLVYVEKDASEARKLIYGLLLANAVLSGLSLLAALHLKSPATRNVFNLPQEFFVQDMRVMETTIIKPCWMSSCPCYRMTQPLRTQFATQSRCSAWEIVLVHEWFSHGNQIHRSRRLGKEAPRRDRHPRATPLTR